MKNISEKYDTVILTHAPKDELLVSLNMLLKQTIKPTKIIIYNTDKDIFYKNITDTDNFKKLLKDKRIEVCHIKKKDFDHGKARNDAAKLCKSPYILFMTDDAIPFDNNMSKNLLKPFSDKKVAVSYARQIAKKGASLKERYVREYNYPKKDIVKDISTEKKYGIKNCFCSNSCAMYDRSIFIKLKRFATGLTQNEDMLYAHTAIEKGYKIVYKSTAVVYHSHNLSYIEQYKRNKDIGTFQKQNKDIYNKYKSEGEGARLVKYVNEKLIKDKKFLDLIDFDIECLFRYVGFLVGKRG